MFWICLGHVEDLMNEPEVPNSPAHRPEPSLTGGI
jgi:hypothetical protein